MTLLAQPRGVKDFLSLMMQPTPTPVHHWLSSGVYSDLLFLLGSSIFPVHLIVSLCQRRLVFYSKLTPPVCQPASCEQSDNSDKKLPLPVSQAIICHYHFEVSPAANLPYFNGSAWPRLAGAGDGNQMFSRLNR